MLFSGFGRQPITVSPVLFLRALPGKMKNKAAQTKKLIGHTCPSGHGSDDSGPKSKVARSIISFADTFHVLTV